MALFDLIEKVTTTLRRDTGVAWSIYRATGYSAAHSSAIDVGYNLRLDGAETYGVLAHTDDATLASVRNAFASGTPVLFALDDEDPNLTIQSVIIGSLP